MKTQNYPPELSQVMGSDSTLPNRIGFCYSRLAGTSQRALRVFSIFSCSIRDDFIGAHNDVKTFIVDQGSPSTLVLVSDGTELEANAEK